MIYYAGIGSRKTPWPVCDYMRLIGIELARAGLTLRSGRAIRADQSFEMGCNSANGLKEIFTADQCLVPWAKHAAAFHPAWNSLDDQAKRLHGRNSAIMLGAKLDTPVLFVVCYTPDGTASGGTGQALRIAEAMNIPVFNLYYGALERIEAMRQFMRHTDGG